VVVFRLQVGPLATNAYLVKDEASGEGAVIDPGDEAERILERCRGEGLVPRFIINTHGHVDHTGANAALKRAFPEAPLCIGAKDAALLGDPARSLAAAVGAPSGTPPADLLLEHGREVTFGSTRLRVVETPGHTPGAVCLLAADEEPPQLFCGDLVFQQGVGRTDLPGGSWRELVASIRREVLTLPDETVLWPGHGGRTSVGAERAQLAALG
jgi:glyoxylase-like metal-dependent hydrolase (beta-lactamase superfamily II)